VTKNLIEKQFDHATELTRFLLAAIRQDIEQTIAKQQNACLLVSGGSTPKMLYQSLSQQSLAWNQVAIAMVDERWVDSDQEKSNERFIKQTLVQDKADKAHFYPMIDASKPVSQQDLQLAAKQINGTYSQLPKNPISILGMGADGHTASFFPHAKGLDDALNSKNSYVCAIEAKQSETTGEQTERLSITLDYLLSSQAIYLLITGKKKWEVYQRALTCDNYSKMPVSAVLKQTSTPVSVYWCA